MILVSQISCTGKPISKTKAAILAKTSQAVITLTTRISTPSRTPLNIWKPPLYTNTPTPTPVPWSPGTPLPTPWVPARVPVVPLNNWELSGNVKESLDQINSLINVFRYETIEEVECGNHPEWGMLGHVIPRIVIAKQNLGDLNLGNIYFQYDCTQRLYRVVMAAEQPDPLCYCPP